MREPTSASGAREIDLVLLIADLSGYTALAETHGALQASETVLRFGLGIHRGPIVEREGRLFGAPINLTARLAAHASSGQVLCTEPIASAARVFADVEPRPIGERRFRNVAHPVAVVELVRTSERRAAVVIDPVCRMQVAIDRAATTIAHGGATYRFCSTECARAFAQAPGLYAGSGGE